MRAALQRTAFLLLVATGTTPVDAAEISPQQRDFFETRVRPLLASKCYSCHSQKAKAVKGGLLLDSQAGLTKGGDSGVVVVPGQPEKSLLIAAIQYRDTEMPPDGKLNKMQIATLVQWVALGAPWPAETSTGLPSQAREYNWQELRQEHWAWQPVKRPGLPTVQESQWIKNPIDFFVLARLEANALQHAPPADRRTLIRRAYFDLIGLPPRPEEIAAFIADSRPDAYVRIIDNLLARPQYGERWGRHWLDVARYSDGLGGFGQGRLPHAYQYRDWITNAFNRDLSYDRFVRLQIAGPADANSLDTPATGFLALGPTYKSDGGDPDSKAQAQSETLDDRVDTFSRGFLGLTVSCARCHDHKFDPIPTIDYYSLAGVFNNTRSTISPFASPEIVQQYQQAQQVIKQLDAQAKKLQGEYTKGGRKPTPVEQERLKQLRDQSAHAKRVAPPRYPEIHSLVDSGNRDMPIALRGNLRKPGPVAPRRPLRILSEGEPPLFQAKGSGRQELAESITQPGNPLTARVMVNRIWQHHLGRALVRSPSNFGTLGESPTHPLLLDWLATEFIRHGWSIKHLHRTIMTSSSYQMSSRFDSQAFNRDGDNRLVWRMNPRRLDVEAWRDSLLQVTGELDQHFGGPPTEQLLGSRRRTLYTVISRNRDRFESDEFLKLFDFPTPRATSAQRKTSTVPQQFLFMLNSTFMIDRAKALAARLEASANDDATRIDNAYQLLYGRQPSSGERTLGLAFLEPKIATKKPRAVAATRPMPAGD
ncbi:MAG: PSD1 and planctomycete cytochrome C domain-containing protein, partial [Pirellulaceae bacterium]